MTKLQVLEKQAINSEQIGSIIGMNYRQLLEETNVENINIVNSIYNKYNVENNKVNINQDIFILLTRVSSWFQNTEKNDWVRSSLWGMYYSICDTGKSGIHLDIDTEEYRVLRDYLRMNNKKLIDQQVDDFIFRYNDGSPTTQLYTLEPNGNKLLDLEQLLLDFHWKIRMINNGGHWVYKVEMLIKEIETEIYKLKHKEI